MVIGSVDLVFYFPLETANHLLVMGNMIQNAICFPKLYEVKPYGAVSHDLETDLHVLVQVVQDSIHIQDSVPLHLVVIYT